MLRRLAIALAAAAALGALSSTARAVELVMVHASWCEVCERWDDEVGVAYPMTSEAKIAPLRRVEFTGKELSAIELKRRVDTTPTFILVHDDAEIDRIEGYTADHFFWSLLGELLKKLPEPHGAEPKT